MDRISKNIVLLGFAVFGLGLLPSCRSIKPVTKITEKDIDSNKIVVNNRTEKKEDTKITPPAKIQTAVSNPCDEKGKLKPFTQQVDVGKAHAKIRIVHDSIYVDCGCDSTVDRLIVESTFKDSLNTRLQKQIRQESTVLTKEVFITPWYMWLIVGILTASTFWFWLKSLKITQNDN
jgi:hypothetical protein